MECQTAPQAQAQPSGGGECGAFPTAGLGTERAAAGCHSATVPACGPSAHAAAERTVTPPYQAERNFEPVENVGERLAGACTVPAGAQVPDCTTLPVAWGPYHPWLYRPRWIYPYRYYPLRWSYSVYSPYYFYSPYRPWPTGPLWGYRSYLGYGWGWPWYPPGAWGTAVVPYYGAWPAFDLPRWSGCFSGGAASGWGCHGACGPLPYDTGPYLGWPYDAGRSFAVPCWGFCGCCAPQLDFSCPPGRRDAWGALHW